MVLDVHKGVVDRSQVRNVLDTETPGPAMGKDIVLESDVGDIMIVMRLSHKPLVEVCTEIAFDGDVMAEFTVVVKGLKTINVRTADFIELGAVKVVIANEMVISEEAGVVAVSTTMVEQSLHFILFDYPIEPCDTNTLL